ncbi:MAG: hypothetical protein ACYS22_04275, partial [Planctomycetota bacterium]
MAVKPRSIAASARVTVTALSPSRRPFGVTVEPVRVALMMFPMKLARPFPSRFFAPLTLLFVAASLSGCDFIKDNSVLGLLEEEFETETLLDVHEFDSQTPTFVDRQLLPATMLPADGVVVDGRLFTFGDGTTDALIYDPADETWTTLPDLP